MLELYGRPAAPKAQDKLGNRATNNGKHLPKTRNTVRAATTWMTDRTDTPTQAAKGIDTRSPWRLGSHMNPKKPHTAYTHHKPYHFRHKPTSRLPL